MDAVRNGERLGGIGGMWEKKRDGLGSEQEWRSCGSECSPENATHGEEDEGVKDLESLSFVDIFFRPAALGCFSAPLRLSPLRSARTSHALRLHSSAKPTTNTNTNDQSSFSSRKQDGRSNGSPKTLPEQTSPAAKAALKRNVTQALLPSCRMLT